MVTFFPLLMWVAALVFTGLAVLKAAGPTTPSRVIEQLTRYIFVFPLGVQGIWAFLGHALFPQETAQSIGWAPSPFQYEMGLANLGLGLSSFYAAFAAKPARIAVTIAAVSFLIGAGLGHLFDMLAGDNYAPGNAGPILITNFLTPIALMLLVALSPRQQAVAGEPSIKPAVQARPPAEPPMPQLPLPRGPGPSGARPGPMPSLPMPSPPMPSPQMSLPPAPPADQSLEDELERARQRMREELARGKDLPPR